MSRNDKEYRNLKKYSLSQVHDLWYKFNQRFKKRNQILSDYIDQIVKEIKPNKEKKYIVYYTKKEKTFQYIFSKSDMGGYGFQHKEVELTRENNLDLLLSDEKPHEMGKEFRRLYLRASTALPHYLKEVFLDLLKSDLQKKIHKDFFESKLITIKISDKKHWVKADRINQHWVDFEYISEANEELIEL